MYHGAALTFYGEAYRIGYGMVNVYKLHGKAADLYSLACFDHIKLRRAEKSVLLKLTFDESVSKSGTVNGYIYISEQIGKRADMVLVSVSDENTSDLVCVFFDISEIRDYEVDARHILIGEGKAAIDEDYIVFIFKKSNVFAYLIKAAEKGNSDGACLLFVFILSCIFASGRSLLLRFFLFEV